MPDEVRRTVQRELDALVAGQRPQHLVWVRRYGSSGATLVRQPDELWEHRRTEAAPTPDGGWHVVVPLWTSDESPSDLSAEVSVRPDGSADLRDVHVL